MPHIERQLWSDFLRLLILEVIHASAEGPSQQINTGAQDDLSSGYKGPSSGPVQALRFNMSIV